MCVFTFFYQKSFLKLPLIERKTTFLKEKNEKKNMRDDLKRRHDLVLIHCSSKKMETLYSKRKKIVYSCSKRTTD